MSHDEGLNTLTGRTRKKDDEYIKTVNLFEDLLDAANSVLSNWLDAGSPHDEQMIALHCAARKLDNLK